MKLILAISLSITICFSVFSQDSIKTVSEIAQPEPVIDGAPKHSDVCFSPRWPTNRPGGIPLDVAPQFHTTRLEWVYLTIHSAATSGPFVEHAREMGYTVCGTVNSNMPDSTDGSPATYTIGRAVDLDSVLLFHSWLPGTAVGCTNNPDYRTLWMAHAGQQIDLGANNLQTDDPGMNGNSYICYCHYCVKGFDQHLKQTLSSQELSGLGIPTDTLFDYRQYCIRIRDDAAFALAQEQISKTLSQYYKEFQTLSTLNFHEDLHAQLDAYAGRNVVYSCNSSKLFIKDMHKIFQMGMFETYPHTDGKPVTLYSNRILPMHDLGKTFIGTFVSSDIPVTRRFISQMYAFGKQVIVPWDTYMGRDLPRLFGTPADYADLYGFVRANSQWLDDYWEAAVAGVGLNETRYEETPPVHLRGGSLQTRAVVRARPGNPDAPVVIHLVEWADEPEAFTVVIDPHRFFGDKPVRVTLSTPPGYEANAHQAAEDSGNYSELSVDTVLASGRVTNIEIPALYPWGLLKVEPVSGPDSSIWQPMMWAATDSYFTSNLHVNISSPSEGMMIRYTLDGSEPTEGSNLYTAPLSMHETTTVRTCAFDSNGDRSPEARATFTFLGNESSLAPDTTGLAANLRLWLRADALSGMLEDGQRVNTWEASAGPDAILQQVKLYSGNITEPPVFRENAINGIPTVSFEEDNHQLGIANFANQYLAGKQFTVFMVSRADDNNFGFCGNGLNGGGGIPRLYLTRNGMSYDILSTIGIGAVEGQASICSFGYDGQTLMTWLDGMPGSTRSQTEPVARFGGGHFAIPFWSGNTPHPGQMAEIIIFDRSLTDEERIGIESYLSEKYALHLVQVWKAYLPNLPTPVNRETAFDGSLHLYPNPGDGSYLNIAMPDNEGHEIAVKIYDLSGKEILNLKTGTTDGTFHIPLNPVLLPGLYIIQISDQGKSYTEKILVN